jgi:hypothetical protein
MLHVIDLLMAPDVSMLGASGQAFVTARLRRTIDDVTRRWGLAEADARREMASVVDEVERETGHSTNMALLRDLMRPS